MLPGLALALVFAEPIELARVIEEAEAKTRDVIRAEADLLLVDVDKARALAAILPSFALSIGMAEQFSAANIEARYGIYETPGCVGERCVTSPVAGGTYDFEYKGFYDAFADPISQPSFTLSLTGRQLLFDGGRWWKVLSRNGDIRAQQAAGLEIARASARLNAVRRFYERIKAEEAVKVAELQLARAEAQLSRVRARVEAGELGDDAIFTAERNLAVDRVAAMQRRFNASSQARALNLAMGRAPEDQLELVAPASIRTATAAVAELRLPAAERLTELALTRRPELQQLRALIGVVAHNIEIRSTDHWPQLALVASYSRQSRRPDRVFSDPTTNYYASLGLAMSWTLFAGGAIDANVTEATHEMQKARAAYDETMRFVRSEVLERHQRLTVLQGVHANAVLAARAARRARTLVEAKSEATALELRDAEILESQAVLGAIEARIDLEIGQAELARAAGVERFEEL